MTDMTTPTWKCGCGISHYVEPGTKNYKCPFGCGQTFTEPNLPETAESALPAKGKARA